MQFFSCPSSWRLDSTETQGSWLRSPGLEAGAEGKRAGLALEPRFCLCAAWCVPNLLGVSVSTHLPQSDHGGTKPLPGLAQPPGGQPLGDTVPQTAQLRASGPWQPPRELVLCPQRAGLTGDKWPRKAGVDSDGLPGARPATLLYPPRPSQEGQTHH